MEEEKPLLDVQIGQRSSVALQQQPTVDADELLVTATTIRPEENEREDSCCRNGRCHVEVDEEETEEPCCRDGVCSAAETSIAEECCVNGSCRNKLEHEHDEPDPEEDACCASGTCTKPPNHAIADQGSCCQGGACTKATSTETENQGVQAEQANDSDSAPCCRDGVCTKEAEEEERQAKSESCCAGGNCSKNPSAKLTLPKALLIRICCEICRLGGCCRAGCCVIDCCLRASTASVELEPLLRAPTSTKPIKRDACCDSKGTCNDGGSNKQPSKKKDACCEEGGTCGKSQTDPPRAVKTAPPPKGSVQTDFNVDGMTCTDCCTTLERNLLSMPSVTYVRVTLMTTTATVEYSPAILSVEQILAKCRELGFEGTARAPSSANTLHLQARTKEEANRAAEWLRLRDGVSDVFIGPTGKQAPVVRHHDRDGGEGGGVGVYLRVCHEDTVGPRRLLALLSEATGLNMEVVSAPAARHGGPDWRPLVVAILLTIPLLLVDFILPGADGDLDRRFSTRYSGVGLSVWISLALCTPVQFWCARGLYSSAWKALKGRSLTMDTLVMLSTTVAYVYSLIVVLVQASQTTSFESETFFETSGVLLALILLGRYLEALSKAKASNLLSVMTATTATRALLLAPNGQEIEIHASLIEPNDMLKVLAGAQIPTDGVVLRGESDVNESLLTGESTPVHKLPGSELYGGTINGTGMLVMRASCGVHKNTVSKIAQMVQQAQASQPMVQRMADRIASYFVPAVIVLSLVMFFLWLGLALSDVVAYDADKDTHAGVFALKFAITILVISCPCAIGLAVPTVVMVASAVGAKRGIIFKGGDVIERAAHVDAIVFDKTGTLTRGKPTVVLARVVSSTIADNGGRTVVLDQTTIWAGVGAAEKASEHVLGKAIALYASSRFVAEPNEEVTEFQTVPGKGFHCSWRHFNLRVGSPAWLTSDGLVLTEFEPELTAATKLGYTPVCVALNQAVVGVIALTDAVRDDARDVVQALKAMGVSVRMASGDSNAVCARIGAAVGIDEYQGSMSPGDKAKLVVELQQQGHTVAMVGDGINDSPALAAANVGMSVSSGTSMAVEAASVGFVHDDLRYVVVSLALGRRAMQHIRLNFAWAFLYNAVAIPIASGILIPASGFVLAPIYAGLSELLSSIPVILFSLLLTYYRPPSVGTSTSATVDAIAVNVSDDEDFVV